MSDAEIERFKEINAVKKNKIINIDKMYKQSQEEQKQLKQQLAEKDEEISNIQHRLKVAEKALELACIEELREIGIDNDDLDYKKELSISKQQYSEQAEKELKINDKDYNFEKLLEDKKC